MLRHVKTGFLYAALLVWLIAVVVPLVWVVVNSLRTSQEFVKNPFGMPWVLAGNANELPVTDTESAWESVKNNYTKAWIESRFQRYFFNSILVTSISLLGIIGFGAMASYVLARFRFLGNRALYLYFITGLMVPAQLVLVPLFFQFTYLSHAGSALLAPLGLQVELHDTYTGLILIYIALSLPFTILVLTGFFRSLPGALREAGIIDGCSEFGVFRHIMMPLAKPGLVSAAIFNFIGLWNEYLLALVFVNSDAHKTLPLGLAAVSMQAQYKADFGLMFAGLVIVLAPTLAVYVVLQKQLTRGITVGALKG
ncbi:MAG: carbohydrate ABC transporter permease [Candidatus Hydrogenedentes bacterium]|nr:carbohydrate ABC transporter permease [Candidatus Hydrogenedentota bacterium]